MASKRFELDKYDGKSILKYGIYVISAILLGNISGITQTSAPYIGDWAFASQAIIAIILKKLLEDYSSNKG